jgi:hypothetical protein|tara:strand:+ start:6233 stop:6616 length:384 start_codon:yes stop_codon:yes gene_type:complete
MSVSQYKIKDQTRPYSQDEIKYIREKFYEKNRLSNVVAKHVSTKHRYKVKENGKKYHEINEYNNPDCGNCSVSWKLRKTPNEYKNKANDLINSFYNIFYDNDPEILDYYSLNIEMDFYNWLYNEFNN